ncbi:hypothetical protein NDN08_000565 [Rhodosorus marinus]|uniref:NADPH-dependent diflavin oxidoreductase 1 n=1 Tax=Rhodosorus marinus TaxID=101924 RepID=A0AAV8UNC0_9RHOD|nr:hypothetical protein NDN08_000565 [Rhodosorus marinus]
MGSCLILYATQSGDAEEMAVRIWSPLRCFEESLGSPVSIGEYKAVDLATEGRVVLFVVSTTGDGVVPDEMKIFWRILLNRNLSNTALADLRYSVVGLGDSGYDLFNAAARKLDKRLLSLGAKQCLQPVLCDAADPLTTDKAMDEFQSSLLKLLYGPTSETSQYKIPPPVYAVKATPGLNSESMASTKWSSTSSGGVSSGRLSMASVISNTGLSDPSIEGRDVRHVKLKTIKPMDYSPGDVVYVYPRNPSQAVESFLDMMRLDGNQVVEIEARGPSLNVRSPCSIREIVYGHLDLLGTPSRRFMEKLSGYAVEERERERLSYLASEEGSGELYQYAVSESRSTALVFRDFPSVRPGLSDLLGLVPRLRPRAFSIASSSRATPGEIHLCAAIVRYRTSLPNLPERVGLCSGFLSQLDPNDLVPFRITRGTLNFPNEPCGPVIMVGPGTGIAPFRAFLLHSSRVDTVRLPNVYQSRYENDVDLPNKALLRWTRFFIFQKFELFFGCRREAEDFLFKEELTSLESTGRLSLLVTAFSREQRQKVYVQDKIASHQNELASLLDHDDARIYVAGTAGAMPKAVRAFVNSSAASNLRQTT